ncbi:tetratricopeptide repeat protein [soil metagenome]
MNQDIRTPPGAAAQALVQRALTAAVAHIGAGRLEEAVAALEANGGVALKNPVGRNILGDIRLKQGRPRDAVRDFDAALKMAPSFPEAHANRGVALQEMGRLNEALAAEERALSYRADYATAHFNRGNILDALGRHDDAVAAYGRALRIQPEFAEALLNRGNALIAKGDRLEALKDFRRALDLRPNFASAHLGVAAIQSDLRQFDLALAAVDAAVTADPLDFTARRMRAKVLLAAGRHEEALTTADALVAHFPHEAKAHMHRAQALEKLRLPDEALAAADEAVRLDPKDHEAHTARAMVLSHLGRYEEQWQALDTAGRLGAASYFYLHARAIALTDIGDLENAILAYDRAIEKDPIDPIAHYHRSFANLTLGNHAEGWPGHEWRLKLPEFSHPDLLRLARRWSGEDLTGKKILLYYEQGHGDTIQFLRFVPQVVQRGAKVTVLVYEALRRLVAESFPDVDVTGTLGMRSGFDFQSPLMSLPNVLHTSEATIPRNVPYIAINPERVEKWRRRLGADGFRIGITWQGNPKYPGDRRRSIPLRQFAPLAAVPGVRLISLQSFNGLDQLSALPEGMKVDTLGEEIVDNPDGFRDVAAVMANLDLMVMSDSAPPHLAGALGRPVWVALGMRPDWRWQIDRSDSPWYPTMRLFRQTRLGDWESVFAEIAGALRTEVAGQPPR